MLNNIINKISINAKVITHSDKKLSKKRCSKHIKHLHQAKPNKKNRSSDS